MKYHISNIVVVEGKEDEAYLSSFIDAIYVKTNGYQIPEEEIRFLNNPRNKKPVIILTDSDEAGKVIRGRINKVVNNPINVEVDINKCDRNGKHGIAECDKQEIINALKEHIDKETPKNEIEPKDLIILGIDKDKREQLSEELSLGICNNKTLVKRLNYLGFTKDELKQYGNK